MGFRRRIAAGFVPPFAGLVAVAVLLGWLCRYPGFYADKLLLVAAGAACLWRLRSRVRRGSRLTARFVAALEHGDVTQTFRGTAEDAGLDQLGEAYERALQRLRAERHESTAEARFAGVLVDETPTPLLLVEGGTVHLANKAARRLFREADGRPAEAFAHYGREFAAALTAARPGERTVCPVRWNGMPQRAIISVALAERQGTPWRVISVQIIQGELDAAEMATQTDLVRVLTHEIMNSLTPITSLAGSASQLLDAADDAATLADARAAVGALSRRAAAISAFVAAYRSFSEAPAVTMQPFAAGPWLADLARAFEATPQGAGTALDISIVPPAVTIRGDQHLLGQVVLNLLKNAGQACASAAEPRIVVELDATEGRLVLSISDNGPGIPPPLQDEVFLPFFTTKADGSGVGLSFAKQIVLLHGGVIGLAESRLGGATFQIVI